MKISGIYEILNVISGKRYLGSSHNIKSRWSAHRWSLEVGKHHSILLQRAWGKYGSAAFVFRVLELAGERLLEIEQNWLDRTLNALNISDDARSPCLGKPLSESTRLKIGRRQKGMKRSLQTRQNISLALKGKPKSEAHKERLRIVCKGRQMPKNALVNAAVANKGRSLSPEHVAKVVAANTGKKRSSEYVEKHRARLVAMAFSQRGKPKPRKSISDTI